MTGSMLALDFIQTLAFAGIVLFAGYRIRAWMRPLSKYNVPAPVVGGLIVAVLLLVAKQYDVASVQFDTKLQTPLMIAFFTSIGFGASVSLLRVGGPQVLWFLLLSTLFAIGQNIIGALVAIPLGVHPLLGVLAGSVTLTGGPATGLAFAPLFEQAGVQSAVTIAVAAAMVGIVSGGIIGGPIGTFLIRRFKLKDEMDRSPHAAPPVAAAIVEDQLGEAATAPPAGEDKESYLLLKSVVVMLTAMWIGSFVSERVAALGITLPAYIGAMVTASIIRNLDDRLKWINLSQRTIDDVGNVTLALFISMALMSLRLWEIASLAMPLLVILIAQIVSISLVCLLVVYRTMGRDYDAAVMSSGFCGFMLGTTANAMANMESLVERYGPAPRAFLVVPIVGAFFIDFTNAIIITACLNLFR